MGSAREASAPWGGTRAAGREAQAVRGSEESGAQGVKPNCAVWATILAAWVMIRAAEQPFAQRRQ